MSGLLPNLKLPTLAEIKAEKARRSLLGFTTFTYPEYEVNWHHAILCNYLDRWAFGDIKRLMVFMPPRNGKSELVSRRLPAYILGRDPNTSVIATSYTADLASMMNRDAQRIIDGEKYHELFPKTNLFGSNVRTVAKGSYLRNSDIFEIVGYKGIYKSAGVGGAITGMGCKYGIIDDPIKNRAEAESVTYRKALWDWYTSTFYTRLEKDARVLITLTRWHEDDLAGRLLKLARENPQADQWTVISFPAIAEDDKHQDDIRKTGEPLWPGKYPLSELNTMKATMGSYEWNALMQQRPSVAGGNILKREWWKYWHLPGQSLPPITVNLPDGGFKLIYSEELPRVFDEHIQSWDMAFKDTKGSAYVAGQTWGRKGANKYLLDQLRDKMDFVKTIQAVKTLTEKWPKAMAKLVEDKANGPAVISSLKDKIPGLIEVQPEGSKESRAYAVSPQVEAGNVYLPHPMIYQWVDDYVAEMTSFPNGTYKDQVDATTQALQRLGKNRLSAKDQLEGIKNPKREASSMRW